MLGIKQLKEDIQTIMEKDPAATSALEVLMTYPGLKAIRRYRRAHWFHQRGFTTISRMMSDRGRSKTGIEIHPGAQLGRRLFIDHGMGIVIGETAIVGDDVTIYHGVTLGGTGKETGKRHPTIGNNVVISAGAKILGNITIGDYSRIGAQSVVLKPVPPHCTVVGIPGKIVIQNEERVGKAGMPDPVLQEINFLKQRVRRLEDELYQYREANEEAFNEDL
jgi:serine O-acetyltransferase